VCPMINISSLNHRQDRNIQTKEVSGLFEQECLAGEQEEYGMLHKIYLKIMDFLDKILIDKMG